MERSLLNVHEYLTSHRSVTGQNWEEAWACTTAVNQIPQLWARDHVNRLEIGVLKEAQERKGLRVFLAPFTLLSLFLCLCFLSSFSK